MSVRAAMSGLVMLLSLSCLVGAEPPTSAVPIVPPAVVFEEKGGIVAVEAEHYFKQTAVEKRAWHLTTPTTTPPIKPDGDPAHTEDASGGAYLEALPDTRRSDKDKLIAGENFANEPGKMAVLHYKVHFNTPGRYFVWVRAFSTGAEDNGLHVGIDGTWPESGRRMQWAEGKNSWRWDCKQRTQEKHTGEPMKIWLDIAKAGEHEICFSMREDGFEFDRWLMTTSDKYELPQGTGPATLVKAGQLPRAFASQPQTKTPAPKTTEAATGQDGNGSVSISGDLKPWHKATLTLDGPFADERGTEPNPFTDYRMTVTFQHESGQPEYRVPGYFAADGAAGASSATSGTKWRAHLSPDKPGKWNWRLSFVSGKNVAVDDKAQGQPVAGCDGKSGTFEVGANDKQSPDFRALGRLEYVGKHYPRFAGTGDYFLKVGADSPETFLAYSDFDGTETKKVPLKTWKPHVRDWKDGDPTWKDGKGKGMIGAINYLSSKGVNSISFMPYNAGGDGDNVWPFIARDDKFHCDCSKLDQWGIVFEHAQTRGLFLHFKLQEQENDDNRLGAKSDDGKAPTSLDGGKLGFERKLYLRELIARYGHLLALNWNLGEENTQSTAEQKDMAQYIADTDPYAHAIVVHTFPNKQDDIYTPLLGKNSALTGASLQNAWNAAHQRTHKWVTESAKAGKPWIVANDEQGPASLGVPPDAGYAGHDGVAIDKKGKGKGYTAHDIRKLTLWGTLTAGGAGVEYYFGYQLPQNDLNCEDFRSRDKTWDYGRIALGFFRDQKLPVTEMTNRDELVGNPDHANTRFCLAKPGEVYVVYLPTGGSCDLDLTGVAGAFEVNWFNPRSGGPLQPGSLKQIKGGLAQSLGVPPADGTEDWVVLVRKVGN